MYTGLTPESKESRRAESRSFGNLGMPFAFLSAECWDKTVGFCVGASGAQECSGQAPVPRQEREVFLMKEFSAARREQVLAGFREGRLPKIELKAIVTPHNQTWTLGELITELGKSMPACRRIRSFAGLRQKRRRQKSPLPLLRSRWNARRNFCAARRPSRRKFIALRRKSSARRWGNRGRKRQRSYRKKGASGWTLPFLHQCDSKSDF